MKGKLLAFAALLGLPGLAAGAVTVKGSEMQVIEIKPDASSGLNSLLVVFNTAGCTLEATGVNGYQTRVYRYSNLGGGYAEEITEADRSASSIAVALTSQDLGYIFEDGDSRTYFWVVNYANHYMTVGSLQASPDQECDYSILEFDGNAGAITYYSINGQPRTLSREITIDYTSQKFNSQQLGYETEEVSKTLESINGRQISLSPPAYCSTYFTLTGDRFLQAWDRGVEAETAVVAPFAVDCHTEALQEDNEDDDNPSNVIKGDTSGLGGSAPADISFVAYTTEGVIHYEWQMSREQDFENPEYRFYQQDLDYTFTEEGTYYLRFIGSNAEGTCETFGDIYTVSIGASALECPNAFSPNDDGVNDIWKVSYRSLIDFHCEIFNRSGQKIIGFDDPSSGWDGTWHGKKVKPGVYYYVIVATGADGKKYKKSGDINIINSVRYGTSSPSEPTE